MQSAPVDHQKEFFPLGTNEPAQGSRRHLSNKRRTKYLQQI